MNAMVETSMLGQGHLVVKPAKVVDSVRRPLGKTASLVKNVPVLQELKVAQSVKAESFQSSEKGTGRRQVYGRSHYYVRSNRTNSPLSWSVYALPRSLYEESRSVRNEEATRIHK